MGDRHLDNLMLATDGRFFHIDFGFIMGRDPKLFPPPMKLCREMVDGMGGPESDGYGRFKTYCCEAYNILRKSTNLILNLISLMGRSGIPDISDDPGKALLKLEAKFQARTARTGRTAAGDGPLRRLRPAAAAGPCCPARGWGWPPTPHPTSPADCPQLDLDDEAAVQHFQAVMNESASALFEQIKESAHRIAQYWRR